MATDGERPETLDEDDMLPDEAAVIAERAGDLDDLDDEAYLTTDDLAAALDAERE
jgi:hypothetical protein